MKTLPIRARMLLAALLPMTLVCTVLAMLFMAARFDDLQDAYAQRTRALARQVALASEYGLFTSNAMQLQTLLGGVMQEPDVRWVGVFDRQGVKQVSAGDERGGQPFGYQSRELHWFDEASTRDWLAQPVFASRLAVDDLYQAQPALMAVPVQLGQIQIVFSREALTQKNRDMQRVSALIGLIGLGFGLALAWYLTRGVSRPIARLTALIERIGAGDFSLQLTAQEPVHSNDPLQNMQQHLYQMAGQLALARDDLERQVMRATQALREKKEEAERANLAKSRFLASASHDLRQPVQALGLFVSRLSQMTHDVATRQLVAQVEQSVVAMQYLLDGLLDISRLQAQMAPLPKRPIALGVLFDQLDVDLRDSAQEKGLRLRIRPTRLWVQSDALLMYRMLLNLVGNALRYTERGGVLVAARASADGQRVRLQVWDTGLGIAPEHQQAVFDEFFQVASARRGDAKGLGLGLSIVQRSAQLLEHRLSLTSQLGQGSRFELELASAEPAATRPPARAGTVAPAHELRGISILVVEDDALVLAALHVLLDGWGLQVHTASGFDQAQTLVLQKCEFALILSDFRLQDSCDGIEVIQRLRLQLQRQVPACLMSGDTDAGLVQSAQSAGLTLLHKPVRPAKLRSLLRRLLLPSETFGA